MQLGELTVITINNHNGKVERVDGVAGPNQQAILNALNSYGFPADDMDSSAVQTEFTKATTPPPTDRVTLIIHTTTSPGCTWVLQDGFWKRVCR